MSNTLHDSIFDSIYEESGQETQLDLIAKADMIRAGLFKQQLDLVLDNSRFKSGLCSRRAGKSRSAIDYMLDTAARKAGANILYIGRTRKVCIKNCWGTLNREARKFDLQPKINETDLIMKLPNGSTITLVGCETLTDADNARGSDEGYDLVVIDECSTFPIALFDYLVNECMIPTLGDRLGTILIIGTPGRALQGLYYLATSAKGQAKQKNDDGSCQVMNRPYSDRDNDKWDDCDIAWSFHSWSTQDNTAAPHIYKDQLATKKRNGWADDDDRWRREYRAEWIASDLGFVYAYLEDRNGWVPDETQENEWGLPDGHEWHLGLGADLGFVNNFALVVAAWAETSPDYYFIDAWGSPGLTVVGYAAKILEFQDKYGQFDVMVGDRGGQGTTILETLSQEYGIDLEPADKTGDMRDLIDLLNSDLKSGRCHILKDSPLAREMQILQWRPDGKTQDTSDVVHNDHCDAGRYLWKYCHQHIITHRMKAPEVGTQDYYRARIKERADKIVAEKQRKARMSAQDIYQEERYGLDTFDDFEDTQGWN